VLAIGPKFRGFKPGRERWFLRAMKVSSTTSFGREKRRLPHVRRFYGMLKIPMSVKK
jgi:hypothetical protein